MSNHRSNHVFVVDDSDSDIPRSYQPYFESFTQNQNQNQNPSSNEVRFISQNHQNPYHENQALEEAFSRLSVTNQSNGYGVSSVDDSNNVYPYYNYGFQASNLVQNQVNNNTGFNRAVRSNIGHGREIYHQNGYSNAILARQRGYGYGYGNGNGNVNGNYPLIWGSRDSRRKLRSDLLNESSVPNPNCYWDDDVNVGLNVSGNGRNSHWFDNFRGKVHALAKEQHGSRILQEVMKQFGTEGVSFIFNELIDHVTELMIDPFGNYVIQKMIELGNENQQTQLVLMVTHYNQQLIRVCLNPHGSRSVETLLEKVTTGEQRALIMAALCPGAVLLSKDINGHRVVLHCLKNFPDATKQFLHVVASNSLAIGKDKTGCCVLQHCVNYAQGDTKKYLIDDIVLNAPILAEDCYGNYVIQHILSLKIPIVTDNLRKQLERQFVYLSCNKYGSNVVEKFFHDAEELQSVHIILELLSDPNVERLLVDPYGNFVISNALTTFKAPPIRKALVDLIQKNYEMMRSNMFGKKVLERFDKLRIRHA